MSQCATNAASRLARGRASAAFVAAWLALATLGGCSTSQIDAIPKDFGGLPEGAPKRAETPPAFPAVHDMPPARSQALMDADEQKRLEADLVATRTRLQGQQKGAVKDAAKPGAAEPSAKPAAKAAARPTIKRGRRPTSLSEDKPVPAGQGQAQPAPAAQANAPAGGGAWPAPAAPNASGFGRNP